MAQNPDMLIETLKSIVGPRGWTDDPVRLEPHLTEWRDAVRGRTLLMVLPSSTAEVAAIVKACAAAETAIVPQGGNTGMCAGAVPDESGTQVLLNLSRHSRIRAIDSADRTISVDAGCVLEQVQRTAREAGLFFPLSLGAEGSCQIGGNLATNAGGINVLRYGTARSLVLGLEAVLPDGTIWDGIRTLHKDTAGYDIKQIFIGSEGTLGVITGAALRLFSPPQACTTAALSLRHADGAVQLLSELQSALPDRIQAYELISAPALRLTERFVPELSMPFDESGHWYVLMEAEVGSEDARLEAVLCSALERKIAHDVVIAKSQAESERLWRLRHSISAAEKHAGEARKHDISVPVGRIAAFLEQAETALLSRIPDASIVAFGHVGDGNLHYNVTVPDNDPAKGDLASRIVYELVAESGGSFSAEHGVGRLKREYLTRYRSATEVDLMRRIKNAIDPNGLMNPGKVL